MGKKKKPIKKNVAKPLKITYVLPVFNSQATIAQTITSLVNQKNECIEIIIIDDHSEDYTPELIKLVYDHLTDSNRAKIKEIIFNKTRRGAAYCRNLGNLNATGDIIAVCDADFYYDSRGLAIEEFFTNEENKDKSVFYSALHLRDDRNPVGANGLMEAYEWDFNSKCPISHPTVAYKKEVIKEVSYKTKSQETDLYEFFLLDAHKKGFKFGGCQNPLMCKLENNSIRNKEEAGKLKADMYKEYGIEL